MDFYKNSFHINFIYFFVVLVIFISRTIAEQVEEEGPQVFSIEGRVEVVSTSNKDWISNTQVLVDGGLFIGHLRYIHFTVYLCYWHCPSSYPST